MTDKELIDLWNKAYGKEGLIGRMTEERRTTPARTDEMMMALALHDAEASEDEERILLTQSAALAFLHVPLDWSEQGIDWRASAVLDALIARNIRREEN